MENTNWDRDLEPPHDELWDDATNRAEGFSDKELLLTAKIRCPEAYESVLWKLRAAVAEAIYEEWKYGESEDFKNE